MATDFPTDLDNFPNPEPGDQRIGNENSDLDLVNQLSNLNDAVEALQAKVGVNSSVEPNSLDYKIANAGGGGGGFEFGARRDILLSEVSTTNEPDYGGDGHYYIFEWTPEFSGKLLTMSADPINGTTNEEMENVGLEFYSTEGEYLEGNYWSNDVPFTTWMDVVADTTYVVVVADWDSENPGHDVNIDAQIIELNRFGGIAEIPPPPEVPVKGYEYVVYPAADGALKPGVMFTGRTGSANSWVQYPGGTLYGSLGSASHSANRGKAQGSSSSAEGDSTATGSYSHAEGNQSTAGPGTAAHAEGSHTLAYGGYSHAEGNRSQANGDSSHASGQYAKTDAINQYAHGAGHLLDSPRYGMQYSRFLSAGFLTDNSEVWFSSDDSISGASVFFSGNGTYSITANIVLSAPGTGAKRWRYEALVYINADTAEYVGTPDLTVLETSAGMDDLVLDVVNFDNTQLRFRLVSVDVGGTALCVADVIQIPDAV